MDSEETNRAYKKLKPRDKIFYDRLDCIQNQTAGTRRNVAETTVTGCLVLAVIIVFGCVIVGALWSIENLLTPEPEPDNQYDEIGCFKGERTSSSFLMITSAGEKKLIEVDCASEVEKARPGDYIGYKDESALNCDTVDVLEYDSELC